jgi:hypothetical protein
MSNHIHPTIAHRSKPFTQPPPSNKMARPLQTPVYDLVVVELAQYVNSTAELKGRFDLAIKQARDSGIVEMRKINDMDDFYDYCNEVSAPLVLETVHFILTLDFHSLPPSKSVYQLLFFSLLSDSAWTQEIRRLTFFSCSGSNGYQVSLPLDFLSKLERFLLKS